MLFLLIFLLLRKKFGDVFDILLKVFFSFSFFKFNGFNIFLVLFFNFNFLFLMISASSFEINFSYFVIADDFKKGNEFIFSLNLSSFKYIFNAVKYFFLKSSIKHGAFKYSYFSLL